MQIAQDSILRQIFTRNMLTCVLTGFVSGLPLYLLLQLVPAWLDDSGIDLTVIGLIALVGLPYSWKFAWAPLMDRYFIRSFGRRKSWIIPAQIGLFICIASLGLLQPKEQLNLVIALTLCIAFLSASLDVVIDGYRREILSDEEQGLGSSIHVNAYRTSSFIPGSLSLILSDHLPWDMVFLITASFLLITILLSFNLKEAELDDMPALPFLKSITEPFNEFMHRNGIRSALQILLFMLLYKLGDTMATTLSTVFYLDLGFSKTQIGVVAKNSAFWPMIIGGMFGGILMLKIGINRALWLFGVVQLITILGFAVLAEVGNSIPVLAIVIALEYLGVGLGTAAFVAFIARTTSRQFAATQFALLTAFAVLPRTLASSMTGFLVEYLGWTEFYLLCALLALPGMFMLFWVAPFNASTSKAQT